MARRGPQGRGRLVQLVQRLHHQQRHRKRPRWQPAALNLQDCGREVWLPKRRCNMRQLGREGISLRGHQLHGPTLASIVPGRPADGGQGACSCRGELEAWRLEESTKDLDSCDVARLKKRWAPAAADSRLHAASMGSCESSLREYMARHDGCALRDRDHAWWWTERSGRTHLAKANKSFHEG